MDPARKRKLRLIVSLTVAMLLASGLIYTSFSAATPALSPSQIVRDAQPGVAYQLTGTVVAGTVRHLANGELDFRLADRSGARVSVPVLYSGTVPDPFRVGRELIVTVQRSHGGYVAERNSMITKCPSKYSASPKGSSA
jgi:cytochrome c-type biogenesis protein CcmE